MRVPVQAPLTSARPTRGILLATLMGMVAAGLVVGSNVVDRSRTGGVDAESEQALGLADQTGGALVLDQVDVAAAETELDDVVETTDVAAPELDLIEPADSAYDEADRMINAQQAAEAQAAAEARAEAEAEAEAQRQADEEAAAAAAATATTEPPPETPPPSEEPAPTGPESYVDTGYGVLVPPVLLEIRRCESHDNYTAANPTSSARGAYQFTSGTWNGYGGYASADLAPPAVQDQAALDLYNARGTQPWNASDHCWG